MNKKNELALIEKVENKLRKTQGLNVFPLMATHRKELRQLRDRNLGDLRSQLNNIKSLKIEEYISKHSEKIKKEFDKYDSMLETFNNEWEDFIKNIINFIEERKEREKELNFDLIDVSRGYRNMMDTSEDDLKRIFKINKDRVSKEIIKKKFNEKFGKQFKEMDKKIDDLNTKYEEAINFGDLEIVKEIYYLLKDADKFFEKISKLKVV